MNIETTRSDSTNRSSVITTNYLEEDVQNYFLAARENDLSIFHCSGDVTTEEGFDFKNWIVENSKRYTMDSGNFTLAYFQYKGKPGMENQVRMESIVNDTNVRYELWGQPAIVKAMKEDIDKLGFKKSEDDVEISWVFSDAQGNVQSFNVPLLIPDVVNGAYPWLNTSLETYVKNYMQSRASILILIGPPGTGKTTFIKELIRASKKDCMVTYDTKLLFQDSFFASFMSGGDDLLVLEDADEIMGSRRDGNSLMHRFLSASDGLISGRGKKIIFTTNLPSVRDVDSALIRPGRCYDILATRKLTLAECKVITSGLGKSEIDEGLTNSDLSLAELFALINKREEEKISVKEITSKRVGNPVGFFG